MYRIGFIIEQALGHITHTKNLQANVPKDGEIKALWGLPRWQTEGWLGKMPVVKSNWTVQAGLQARRLVRDMQQQGPLDALFFHTQVTAVLAQNWVRRIPSVVSLDATPKQYDSLGEFYAHEPGPAWLEQRKWELNRDLFRSARHIVSWSKWARQGLADEYEVPSTKVTVIPPGVTVQEWHRPVPRQPHNGPVKILFVGGNLERKGGLLLLEAFRQLRSEHEQGRLPAVELHLVTRDQVEKEPCLYVYNEMQANSAPLKQLYFDSDIFCLPTFGDCLPMVLSEAGATELPVVSTDVAAIPEIVEDGVTGFIIPPGDTRAITAALRRLVQDPVLRQQQGQRARQLVDEQFDAAKNAFRLLALLKQIVDETKGK